jgi:hypothetical protein
MNKSIHVALIVAATAGALLTGVIVPQTSQDEQLGAVRNDLDVRIAEAAAGARARAATLAQLPRIGWAVATDQKTFMDLTAEELGFRTHPGETIEITQVTLSDRRAHTLLRLPPAASGQPPMTEEGTHVITDGAALRVAAVVAIEPRRRAKELTASVAVTLTVDVGILGERLAAQGLAARLETAGGSVSIGGVQVSPALYTTRLALRSAAGDPVTLLAYAPGASKRRPVISAILWALALASGAMFILRRSSVARVAPLAPVDKAPPFPAVADATTWSYRGPSLPRPDADDPFDTNQDDDGSDITLNGEEPNDQAAPRKETSGEVVLTDSVKLPGAVFETALQNRRRTTEDPRLSCKVDRVLFAEYSALFREFVRLRRTCGEPTASIHEDYFIQVLAEKRAAVIAEQAVKDVTFRLAFDNGKAGVRYKPVA